MNTQTVTINLVPGLSTPPVVNVKQGDIGRPLAFRVMDGTTLTTLPTGVTAKVEGTKPSGLGFSVTGTISGNTVTLDTTEEMTQEAGKIPTEISFTKTGLVLGTANFILAVEHDPHPEGTTDGTQETMANLETRLQGEIDDLSDRIDDIEAGGSGLSQTEKNLILTLFSKAAYAESDAETAYDALETLWQVASYTITWSGDNYTKGNPSTVITEGSAFVSTVTANTGYELTNVTVTMGGVIVTGAWSGGQVTIPSVTGNIVITVSAVQALPSGYTAYDYIENTAELSDEANNIIDTEINSIYCDTQYIHELVLSINPRTGTNNALYGCRNATGSAGSKNGNSLWGNTADKIAVGYNGVDSGYTLTFPWNEKHTLRLDTGKVYIDGTQVLTPSGTRTSYTSSSIRLFGAATNESSYSAVHGTMRIYSVEIIDSISGSTIAKLVPCTNNSSIPGVYDLVRQSFHSAVNYSNYSCGND